MNKYKEVFIEMIRYIQHMPSGERAMFVRFISKYRKNSTLIGLIRAFVPIRNLPVKSHDWPAILNVNTVINHKIIRRLKAQLREYEISAYRLRSLAFYQPALSHRLSLRLQLMTCRVFDLRGGSRMAAKDLEYIHGQATMLKDHELGMMCARYALLSPHGLLLPGFRERWEERLRSSSAVCEKIVELHAQFTTPFHDAYSVLMPEEPVHPHVIHDFLHAGMSAEIPGSAQQYLCLTARYQTQLGHFHFSQAILSHLTDDQDPKGHHDEWVGAVSLLIRLENHWHLNERADIERCFACWSPDTSLRPVQILIYRFFICYFLQTGQYQMTCSLAEKVREQFPVEPDGHLREFLSVVELLVEFHRNDFKKTLRLCNRSRKKQFRIRGGNVLCRTVEILAFCALDEHDEAHDKLVLLKKYLRRAPHEQHFRTTYPLSRLLRTFIENKGPLCTAPTGPSVFRPVTDLLTPVLMKTDPSFMPRPAWKSASYQTLQHVKESVHPPFDTHQIALPESS